MTAIELAEDYNIYIESSCHNGEMVHVIAQYRDGCVRHWCGDAGWDTEVIPTRYASYRTAFNDAVLIAAAMKENSHE